MMQYSENITLTYESEMFYLVNRLIRLIAISRESKDVVVASEDIDVLVILTAPTPCNVEIRFLNPWNDNVLPKRLGKIPKCKEHFLFLDSFTSCDTTSAFYKKEMKRIL